MSQYAQINSDGIVLNIIEADKDHIDSLPDSSSYVQTFVDADAKVGTRFNYAAIGGKYDKSNDAFISPKPYPSWLMNSKYQWEPPVEKPSGDTPYAWFELAGKWVDISTPEGNR